MNKHIILSGHYQVIPNYLSYYVNKETPNCKGKEHIRYCYYSNVECPKKCPEKYSLNCNKFHTLRKSKSLEDIFGVIKQ